MTETLDAVAAGDDGSSKLAVDTPALLVDLDVMERNIDTIAGICRAAGVAWRPHIKGQKVVEIARKELAAGAIGITCAKLGEAEVFAAAGIRNILIANQVVGAEKMRRLAALAHAADPIVAIDNAAHVRALADTFRDAGRRLGVVIEVDVGMNRAGIRPGAPVAELAQLVARESGLVFRGVIGWESQAVTIASAEEKARVVAAAVRLLVGSAEECRKAGLAVDIVSCGGTGTLPFCARQPGVTEVQAGGGIFSDNHYRQHYHVDFPAALTILTTVASRPTATRIILDAGKKSMSSDAAMPSPIGLGPIRSMRLSAEHTTIELEAPSETPRIGDKVELTVGYSDTTVHLHNEIVAVRNGRVEAIWPIAARGRSK
jgi:D-serine deaminase-like pyridoxal phosphate-dependent protein